MKTLADIAFERDEKPHGFVLCATGALPEDPERAKALAEALSAATERMLTGIEEEFGIELTSLFLRMETFDKYLEEGLPNAGTARN